MEQHNVTDSQHLKDILALGTTSQPFSGKMVNDGLFAYYLAFHITNEAFSDINGGVADYRETSMTVLSVQASLIPPLLTYQQL